MMSIFSSTEQLNLIRKILSRYIRLPFSSVTIPGAIMEGVLAHVRGGHVLNTYDFVDVIVSNEKIGWQVKSTKASTPVTWKRAKLPNASDLIEYSRKSTLGLQNLGNAIIEFCNEHAQQSIKKYDLDEIGYSRLVIKPGGKVSYFEKLLCTRDNPCIFNAGDFEWIWSTPKTSTKKEQLQSLHGIHKPTNKKWWAWHGLGENQLHFSGENAWWPSNNYSHMTAFSFPSDDEKLSLDNFLEMLSNYDITA